MTSVASTAEPERSLVYRFGSHVRPAVDRILAANSEVGDPAIFDSARFPWTAELEAGWERSAAEAHDVLRNLEAVPPLHDISPDHRRIAAPNKWRSFFLWGYGYRSDENCERCPETARLLDCVPGLNSGFFSILAPHTHIPLHRGVTKAILTCHLGLKVPGPEAGRCEMAVGDGVTGWGEGRSLVFDDTYDHQVWNDTDETRVVLLIQFRRPLRQPGKLVGDLFLEGVRRSAFVQEARRNFYAWDGAMRALDQDRKQA